MTYRGLGLDHHRRSALVVRPLKRSRLYASSGSAHRKYRPKRLAPWSLHAADMASGADCARTPPTLNLGGERTRTPPGCSPADPPVTTSPEKGGGAHEARVSADDHIVSWISLNHARASLARVGLRRWRGGDPPSLPNREHSAQPRCSELTQGGGRSPLGRVIQPRRIQAHPRPAGFAGLVWCGRTRSSPSPQHGPPQVRRGKTSCQQLA
jgi:hypothetical protein